MMRVCIAFSMTMIAILVMTQHQVSVMTLVPPTGLLIPCHRQCYSGGADGVVRNQEV
jgi:hypothetical protein